MSFMLNVVMLSVKKKTFMLNIIMLSVVMLSVTNKPFHMNVVVLNVIMLSVFMLNVVVPPR